MSVQSDKDDCVGTQKPESSAKLHITMVRVFTTLVDKKVISAKRLAEKLSGILPSGLIGRLSREFSWFTAADWLEFTVTGAVYGCNGEVDRETQNIVEKLRDSLDLLLRRCVTKTEITKGQTLLMLVVRQFREKYGVSTPNMHLCLHIEEDILRFGPAPVYWAFSFERKNGAEGKKTTNGHADTISVQVMKKIDITAQINKEVKRQAEGTVSYKGKPRMISGSDIDLPSLKTKVGGELLRVDKVVAAVLPWGEMLKGGESVLMDDRHHYIINRILLVNNSRVIVESSQYIDRDLSPAVSKPGPVYKSKSSDRHYHHPEQFKQKFKLKIGSPNVNCKIGRLSKNVMKNRLRSVTANDESRVVLSLQGYQTDNINANYIKDGTGGPGFIAAQGPTDESLEDMWRMVNDTSTNTIVMLTNLFESGQEKCSVYWPESATEKKYFGQFTIQLVDEQRCAEYVVRKLKYEFNKTSRNVMHYQFVHWSDQYLPSTLGLLNFRNRVKKDMKSHKGLTIIHCSEGCGRTGTYIALDLLIDEAHDVKRAKHQTVNVMKCVYDLRLQRTQMVQTANQYAFLHDLLSEALECKYTAVDCLEFPQQLINWRQARKGNHTILKEHFKKVVVSRSASSEAPNDAGLYENTNDSVPPLSRSGEGLMRGITSPSDNVNAVYVDSYVKRCGFIATQAPPDKIKGYYWRMIMETKCPVIVYFNDSQGAEEYWPRRANTEMSYADIHVKCLSANQITDCSMSTECELVCRTSETTQNIKHIEVKGGSNLPTAAQLVSLCTMLEKYAMSRTSPITVQCSDGSRLTGLLMVALNIYLRMILDQEVEVVMEVKLARRSRPQFIPDFETFDLLYDFVSTYLSQHNDYQSLSERRGSENDAQTYASLHHYSN